MGNWSTKSRACESLHQFFSVFMAIFSLVFLWESWVCERVGLWLLCLLLGLFSFHCSALSSLNVMVWVLFYYILFYHGWLLSTGSLFFPVRDRGRVDLEKWSVERDSEEWREEKLVKISYERRLYFKWTNRQKAMNSIEISWNTW